MSHTFTQPLTLFFYPYRKILWQGLIGAGIAVWLSGTTLAQDSRTMTPRPPVASSGTITTSPTRTPGTPPGSNPGTTTTAPTGTSGTPPLGSTPGTTTTSPTGTPGTPPPVNNPGTTTTSPTGTPGTPPPVNNPGTTTTSPTGTPGTPPPVNNPGTTAPSPTGTPGTTTISPAGKPSTTTTSPTGKPETTTPVGSNPDTTTTSPTDKPLPTASTKPSPLSNNSDSVSSATNAQGQTFVKETKVEPVGTVQGGVFSAPLENHGSISQSILNTVTNNQGFISNSTLTPNATLLGGTLTGTITNQGVIANTEFVGLKLNGGILAGNITNQSQVGGVIEDVQLAPQATLHGGRVGGKITAASDSVLQNVRLVADTNLTGGILTGNIQGDPNHPAQLTNVAVAAGTQLSYVTLIAPTKLPEGVVLGKGVTILKAPPLDTETLKQFETGNLHALSPETFKQLQPKETANIPPAAFAQLNAAQLAQLDESTFAALKPTQIAQIPPAAFQQLNGQQLMGLKGETLAGLSKSQFEQIPSTAFTKLGTNQVNQLTKNTVAMMTPAQFAAVPMTALSSLTTAQITGLTPAVIHDLTPTQLHAMPANEIKHLLDAAMGQMLVNLDPTKVSPTDVATLLPSDWKVDTDTGAVTPPAKTRLTFQVLPSVADMPTQVTMPTAPNLNTSFGVGGVGETTVVEDMNQTLQKNNMDFTVSQDQHGILQVQGNNENTGMNWSFMPNSDNMMQVSTDVSSGVHLTEDSFIQMTTTKGQQFVMVPAPKDPVALSKTIENNCVTMGEQGDVFLHTSSLLGSDNTDTRQVVMFDPAIQAAGNDNQQPGLYDDNQTKATSLQQKKVVYSDGTSQTVYPTVYSPDVFIAAGLEITGVEEIRLQANGTFKMTRNGKKYTVYHNFSPKSRTLGEQETVESSLVLTEDNHLTYKVAVAVECSSSTTTDSTTDNRSIRQIRTDQSQHGTREVLEFDSVVEAEATDTCEEVNGKTVCDTTSSE